jgi:hypothetical protein
VLRAQVPAGHSAAASSHPRMMNTPMPCATHNRTCVISVSTMVIINVVHLATDTRLSFGTGDLAAAKAALAQ